MSTGTPHMGSYMLPQRVRNNELPIEVTVHGFLRNGETIPYTKVKKITCSNQEVVIEFHDGFVTEDKKNKLVLAIDERSAHQLVNLPTMIAKHMRQTGLAVYDETAPRREKGELQHMMNFPEFDFERLRVDDADTGTGA